MTNLADPANDSNVAAGPPEKPSVEDLIAADKRLEAVPLDALQEHPRNYKQHPDDQLEHLRASLDEHGWYRNIVIARDGTILAGHGIVKAARLRGDTVAPAHRLDIDPFSPQALRLLAGDNELARLAETDDRVLSELLRDVQESDEGLLGTGYDDMMLANLLHVTRDREEIPDFDAAAEWAGLPEYESEENPWKLLINFRTEEDRGTFIAEQNIVVTKHFNVGSRVHSAWWPAWEEQRNDYRVTEWVDDDGPEPIGDLLPEDLQRIADEAVATIVPGDPALEDPEDPSAAALDASQGPDLPEAPDAG